MLRGRNVVAPDIVRTIFELRPGSTCDMKRMSFLFFSLFTAPIALNTCGALGPNQNYACASAKKGVGSREKACNEEVTTEDLAGLFILLKCGRPLNKWVWQYSDGSSAQSGWHAVGTSIPPATPGIQGSHFSITPAPPSGVSIDSTTGIFSGTPMVTSARTTYRITMQWMCDLDPTITSTADLLVAFGIDTTAANVTCNSLSTPIPQGCSNATPYACPRSPKCFASYGECRGSEYCSNYL